MIEIETDLKEEIKKNKGCGKSFSNGFMLVYCGSKINNFDKVFYCKDCKKVHDN